MFVIYPNRHACPSVSFPSFVRFYVADDCQFLFCALQPSEVFVGRHERARFFRRPQTQIQHQYHVQHRARFHSDDFSCRYCQSCQSAEIEKILFYFTHWILFCIMVMTRLRWYERTSTVAIFPLSAFICTRPVPCPFFERRIFCWRLIFSSLSSYNFKVNRYVYTYRK